MTTPITLHFDARAFDGLQHLLDAWRWALHETVAATANREPSITAFVDLGDYIFGDKDGRDGIALLTGCAGQQVDKTLTEAAFKETVGAYLDNEECLPLDKLDEMRIVLDDAGLLTELYDEWKRDYC